MSRAMQKLTALRLEQLADLPFYLNKWGMRFIFVVTLSIAWVAVEIPKQSTLTRPSKLVVLPGLLGCGT
eukprot:11659984-Heterocapsa_arctica.AAC.1